MKKSKQHKITQSQTKKIRDHLTSLEPSRSIFDPLHDGSTTNQPTGTVSVGDIKDAMKLLPDCVESKGPLDFFSGMRMYTEPPPPAKLKLSTHVHVSDQFRREFDAWLLAEFGRVDPLLQRNQVLVSERFGFMVVPPEIGELLIETTG